MQAIQVQDRIVININFETKSKMPMRQDRVPPSKISVGIGKISVGIQKISVGVKIKMKKLS